MKTSKTSEQYKDEIFDMALQWGNESSDEERKEVILLQLYGLIVEWRTKYYNTEKTMKAVENIYRAVKRTVKKGKKEKSEFFKYLCVALSKAENEFYRSNEEGDLIRVTPFQKRRYKEICEIVRMKESRCGKLSEDERTQAAADWLGISKEKVRECIEAVERNTSGFHIDDSPDGILGLQKTSVSYLQKESSSRVEEDFFDGLSRLEDTEKIKEALAVAFRSRQKKTRPLYRALITRLCLGKVDLEWLKKNFSECIDAEILDVYDTHKTKPTAGDVYLKFYPEANDPDQAASNRLKEFRKVLEIALGNNSEKIS